jgi:hypothetical protein
MWPFPSPPLLENRSQYELDTAHLLELSPTLSFKMGQNNSYFNIAPSTNTTSAPLLFY